MRDRIVYLTKCLLMAVMVSLLGTGVLAGCGVTHQSTADTESAITEAVSETSEQTEEDISEAESEASEQTEDAAAEPEIDRDGVYTSKDDVALYLHTYNELPSNFMTKSEAKKLGWSGGGLEDIAPGMCIGGDYFGNYEGLLPDGDYQECDIDTLGKHSRGPKRIIWDEDGDIYYTEDHYESFEQLY